MKVWFNGKFVEQEEVKVGILDPGFLYGQGVFETMRAYNERVFRLDSHVERLLKALAIIHIQADIKPDLLKKAVKQCLKENGLKDVYLRLTVWQAAKETDPVINYRATRKEKDVYNGVNIAILARSYNFFQKEDYQKGLKSIISKTFRQNEFSPLSRIKSSNYLHLLLAYQEAKKNNADEALILNTRNFLTEASRANVFVVKDNCLLTPSLDCGCLAGITRDTVLAIAEKEKIKTIETKITAEDLEKADEAFLTNSLIEIMPLVSVDGRFVKNGMPGKISELFLKRYRALV